MTRKILQQKWGEDALSMGWVSIPSSLLFLQKTFEISPIGLNVLMHLIMHWWKPDELPYPSQESISNRIGVSKRTVQRAVAELEKSELLIVERTAKDHPKFRGRNKYDLSPLISILAEETLEAKEKIKFYQE